MGLLFFLSEIFIKVLSLDKYATVDDRRCERSDFSCEWNAAAGYLCYIFLMNIKPLSIFYISAFLKSQTFLLPVLYLFYLDNGLTLGDFFLFQGLVFIINVLLQIPMGLLGNFVSRKNLIIFSYVIYLGRIFLWLFFKGYFIVLLGEIFYAISKAVFDAVEAPYVWDVTSEKSKNSTMLKAYSRLNFALCLGVGIASFAGAFLYEYAGLEILLISEFTIMSISVILSCFIPRTYINHHSKYSFEKFKKASACIFKQKRYFVPILYSGLFVAMSHFFFWSFQPLMKNAAVAIIFFGIIVFINNILRALGAISANLISKIADFKTHGVLVYLTNFFAFSIVIFILKFSFNKFSCIFSIMLLCLCIMFQLMFTLRQNSYLQKLSKDRLRGYVASVNMMVARLFCGLVLIIPKYLHTDLSILKLYSITYLFYIVFGFLLLILFCKNIKKDLI